MTPGYLTALAARALGTAPVLRPPTPSRFEPERPQAELSEVTQVVDAAGPAEQAGDAGDLWPPAYSEPGRSPRGSYQTDPLTEDLAPLAAPEIQAGPDAGWPEAPAVTMRRRTAGHPPGVSDSASPHVLESRPATGEADQRAAPTEATQLAEEGGGTPEPASVAAPPRPARRAAANQEPAGNEAQVVVHIGRLEVRAVQSAPAAPQAAAPRSRPAAQPSLAEYLLARDRGQR